MAFPWTNASIHDLREPAAIEAIEKSAKVTSGTYYLNANEHRNGVGPGGIYGWMTIHPSSTYSVGRSLLGSFLQNLGVALCAAWLLLQISGSYGRRVLVAGVVGLVGIMSGPVYDWIWTWYSSAYAAAMVANQLVAYGVMALVLPKLVPSVKNERVEEVRAAIGQAA